MEKIIKCFSLGCKVNSYEDAAIKNKFLSNGYKEGENPSVVILNTCSVTSTADQKSRQYIRRLKNKYSKAILVVMGCYAQNNANYIANELGANIVIGTSSRDKVFEYVNNYLLNKNNIIDIKKPREYKKYEELGTSPYFENVRAMLKIQDGCDNFCSYCLIPLIRGKARSRNKEEIIKEAEDIISKGYKEIVIAGIDIGSYGKDLYNDYSFSSLIDDLSSLNGLKRLTISSLEASQIDDKLISLIKERKNIAKHLHIPLQSGSEDILKSMNRKYDKKSFLNIIKKVKEEVKDIMIAADVIVGFPGETDKHFLETYSFIKECDFNMLHVFPYSKREGTKAYYLKNQVDEKIKKERTKKLIDLSNTLYSNYLDKFNNKTLSVLIESFDTKTNIIKGLSDNYIEVLTFGKKEDINTIKEIKYIKN